MQRTNQGSVLYLITNAINSFSQLCFFLLLFSPLFMIWKKNCFCPELFCLTAQLFEWGSPAAECAELWCNQEASLAENLWPFVDFVTFISSYNSAVGHSEWVKWNEYLSIPFLAEKNAVGCFVMIEQIITSRCALYGFLYKNLTSVVWPGPNTCGRMEVKSDLFTWSR